MLACMFMVEHRGIGRLGRCACFYTFQSMVAWIMASTFSGSALRKQSQPDEMMTAIELVLHKGNIGTLRESVDALGELGVRSLKVNRLHCVGEAGPFPITRYPLPRNTKPIWNTFPVLEGRFTRAANRFGRCFQGREGRTRPAAGRLASSGTHATATWQLVFRGEPYLVASEDGGDGPVDRGAD